MSSVASKLILTLLLLAVAAIPTHGQFSLDEGVLQLNPDSCMLTLEYIVRPCTIDNNCFYSSSFNEEFEAILHESEVQTCADIEASMCSITSRCPMCRAEILDFFMCINIADTVGGSLTQNMIDLAEGCSLDCSSVVVDEEIFTESPVAAPLEPASEEQTNTNDSKTSSLRQTMSPSGGASIDSAGSSSDGISPVVLAALITGIVSILGFLYNCYRVNSIEKSKQEHQKSLEQFRQEHEESLEKMKQKHEKELAKRNQDTGIQMAEKINRTEASVYRLHLLHSSFELMRHLGEMFADRVTSDRTNFEISEDMERDTIYLLARLLCWMHIFMNDIDLNQKIESEGNDAQTLKLHWLCRKISDLLAEQEISGSMKEEPFRISPLQQQAIAEIMKKGDRECVLYTDFVPIDFDTEYGRKYNEWIKPLYEHFQYLKTMSVEPVRLRVLENYLFDLFAFLDPTRKYYGGISARARSSHINLNDEELKNYRSLRDKSDQATTMNARKRAKKNKTNTNNDGLRNDEPEDLQPAAPALSNEELSKMTDDWSTDSAPSEPEDLPKKLDEACDALEECRTNAPTHETNNIDDDLQNDASKPESEPELEPESRKRANENKTNASTICDDLQNHAPEPESEPEDLQPATPASSNEEILKMTDDWSSDSEPPEPESSSEPDS